MKTPARRYKVYSFGRPIAEAHRNRDGSWTYLDPTRPLMPLWLQDEAALRALVLDGPPGGSLVAA